MAGTFRAVLLEKGEGAPSRRIRFDPDGLIFLSPDGSQTRQMRNGAAAAGR